MATKAKTKRPKQPTLAEKRQRMAEAGDVEGLWVVLAETGWAMLDQAEVFRLPLRALEVAGREDASRFSEVLFARMARFCGYLCLRGQVYLQILLAQLDEANRPRAPLSLSDQVMEMLPRLVELQQHLAALLEAQARTARLWALAGKRRRPSDRSEEAAGADHGGEAPETNGRADAAGVAAAARAATRSAPPMAVSRTRRTGRHVMATARRQVQADERDQWLQIQEAFRLNAPHLIRQGTIVLKQAGGRRTWRLRFVVRLGGRAVHRSILLCRDDQPALLRKARELLQRYRERAGWAKELALFARLAGAARAAVARL